MRPLPAFPRPALVRLVIGVVALAAPALAGQVESQSPLEPEWSLDRFSWSGRLPAGAGLRLVNEFGDIRTRDAADDRVEVSAVIQRRADVEAEAEVAIVEDEGELLVEVRFPLAAIDPELLRPGARPDRRVDLVVFVPPGAELRARTVRGLLEAKGLSADAELRSERGDILVQTSASADVNTRHGTIRAVFRGLHWSRPPRLETLTGDIDVELPRGVAALAHISTRAHITSDYSIEIARDGLLRTGRALIGDGGQELFIETNKGRVQLLESIQ